MSERSALGQGHGQRDRHSTTPVRSIPSPLGSREVPRRRRRWCAQLRRRFLVATTSTLGGSSYRVSSSIRMTPRGAARRTRACASSGAVRACSDGSSVRSSPSSRCSTSSRAPIGWAASGPSNTRSTPERCGSRLRPQQAGRTPCSNRSEPWPAPSFRGSPPRPTERTICPPASALSMRRGSRDRWFQAMSGALGRARAGPTRQGRD